MKVETLTLSQPRKAERQLRSCSCAFTLVTASMAWHKELLCERKLCHVVTMNKINLAQSWKSAAEQKTYTHDVRH